MFFQSTGTVGCLESAFKGNCEESGYKFTYYEISQVDLLQKNYNISRHILRGFLQLVELLTLSACQHITERSLSLPVFLSGSLRRVPEGVFTSAIEMNCCNCCNATCYIWCIMLYVCDSTFPCILVYLTVQH